MINPITREATQIELAIDGTVTYVSDEEWRQFLENKLPYIITIPREDRFVYDSVSGKYGYDFIDIDDWIVQNLKDVWSAKLYEFRFANQDDALFFKLFWDSIRPDYSENAPIKTR